MFFLDKFLQLNKKKKDDTKGTNGFLGINGPKSTHYEGKILRSPNLDVEIMEVTKTRWNSQKAHKTIGLLNYCFFVGNRGNILRVIKLYFPA
jgi:hypothetical protein